jgi:acetylornithine deacetylase/succinyl-diaminopimelate desuccinylase-like protein
MYPIDREAAVRLLTECVQLPTVNPPGNEKLAADWLAAQLERSGFSPRVDDLGDNRANIVTVLRGTGEKPALVFNGHLDVVPVGDTPWAHDPFGGVQANGRLYGRGTSDMKSGLMAMVMAVDALKRAVEEYDIPEEVLAAVYEELWRLDPLFPEGVKTHSIMEIEGYGKEFWRSIDV